VRRAFVGLLVLISAVMVLLASTSLWSRRHIVNTDVFVAGAQKILADPAVSSRIESQVVDTVMATPDAQLAVNEAMAVLPPRLQVLRPTIEDGARSLLGTGVRTILSAPRFETLTAAALRSAQTQLLNGQTVEFTLGQAKARLPAQDKTGLAGQALDLIPNNVGITVLTKQQAPRLYTAIDLLKTLWLWAGLIGLALLVWALVLSRRRSRTLRAWAVTTGVIALLSVLSLALLRGVLLGQLKPANVAAADAIYQGITASLRSWTLWLVAGTAVVVVGTLLWGRIGIVPSVRRGFRAVGAQATRRSERRAAAASTPDGAPPVAGEPTPSWPARVAEGTRTFVAGLDLPERLARLAAFLRRNLGPARWVGIAAGAVVLLLWSAPTLSVLIWVGAVVALYLGLIELVLAVGARSEPLADPDATPPPVIANGAAAGGNGAPVPASIPPVLVPAVPVPAAPVPAVPVPAVAVPAGAGGTNGPDEATSPAPPPVVDAPAGTTMTPEGVAALDSKLDLLMRLGDARTAGVLTDEEFSHQKARILAH
jgi:hypothetical protein